MEKESEYLLHLLGAYLRQAEPKPDPEVSWDALIALAHSHNVVGILGYMADLYPICPDPGHMEALRQYYLTTIMEFAGRSVMAEEFSQTLAEHGIDHIRMKGFVVRDFFPVPELRTYGDIDFVIRRSDREKSHALMSELGFQTKTDWEPVYSYRKDSEYYELHTELLETDVSDKADYRGYFRDVWSHAVCTEARRFQFMPEFHFLYLLTHLAKHVTGSGAGIRMYLDVAAYILHYGENLDWAGVLRELEDLALRDFANVIFTMVQNGFGIQSPVVLTPVDDDVLADFMDLTMKGGIFGKNAQDSGTVSVREEGRSGGISRAGTLVRRLFPTAQTIQSRYTYLQDKPWLLPAAWVHRFIKTRDSWKLHAEQATQILSADVEEVQRLKRLYQKIGL